MSAPSETQSPSQQQLEIKRRIERNLDRLPMLPLALAKLMALDTSDKDYYEHLLELVESEPNFAVRILVAANSAASAPVEPVATLKAAVTRIGSQQAAELMLALSVARVFVPRDP